MSARQPEWTIYAYEDGHPIDDEDWKQLLLRVVRMPKHEQIEHGLPLIDQHWAKHGHRDHDGWLRRSISFFKASILEQGGQPERALDEFRALAVFGLHAWYEYFELASGVALCLLKLERYEEAAETLERGLSRVPKPNLQTALFLLYLLSQACAALERPVPPHHAPLLAASAAAHDAEVPEPLRDPARLGEAIAAVYHATRPDFSAPDPDAG